MLKRIDACQVRTGMFIEAVEGTWRENPYQKRFLLARAVAAQQIRASGASAIVINTAKGLDVVSIAQESDARDLMNRRRRDAAAAFKTVQQSAKLLGSVFEHAAAGSTISLDDTAAIVADLSTSLDHDPAVFISVTRLKSKDEATYLHSVAVSGLMMHFGRHLGLDDQTLKLLGIAGLLHDIGKVDVPEAILNKPGSLDEAEMQVMREHPALGYEILSRQEGMPEIVLDVCLHHHERVDGRGYPMGLSGTKLSTFARLAAICDVYDAVTSTRPYKKPWSAGEALAWMLKRDGQFDRKLLKKFMLCLAVALPGSD